MADQCACCDTELSEPLSRETGVCELCRERLGIVPMGGARRPPMPCLRCNGLVFVRAIPREHAHGAPAPMVVTHVPTTTNDLFGDRKANPISHTTNGVGRLDMYICRGCGFVEWYADAPHAIPVGPQYMTELVDYTSSKPYR